MHPRHARVGSTLRRDLYTSITQLKTFLLCPRQFELKYVRGEDPEMVPRALAFGTTFHSALARYYVDVRDLGVAPPVEVLVQLFSDLWRQKLEGKVPIEGEDDEDDTKTDPVDLAAKMLRKFHEQAALPEGTKVEAVEQPFSVTLFHPETGEVQEEKLVGVIDLVTRDDVGLTVVEHKTSSKKFDALRLRYDVQPTAYMLAMHEKGVDEVALRFQVVTKTKSPQVQVEEVVRTKGDEEDFQRIALGVLKAIDQGISYPVRGWQCRSCPYKAACRKRAS